MLSLFIICRKSTHFVNIHSRKIKFFNNLFPSLQTASLKVFPLKKWHHKNARVGLLISYDYLGHIPI